MPRSKLMSYTRSTSQSWFVPSTVAGFSHYVHMLNFEDVHSPVDKASLCDDSILGSQIQLSAIFWQGLEVRG